MLFWEAISILSKILRSINGEAAIVAEPLRDQSFSNITIKADLKDVFRALNPNFRSFTYFSHSANVHSRLDRFYVSDKLRTQVTRARHIAVPRCDHRGCGFNVKILNSSRGRGYWKCNVSVLQDPHCKDDLDRPYRPIRL
jgi:hypothetical protein